MARKDIIRMSWKELKKIKTIQKVFEGTITQKEAAGVLALSYRQIRRIVKRVREEGGKGVIHRSRGKQSPRAVPEGVKAKVLSLYEKRYRGFGPFAALTKEMIADAETYNDENADVVSEHTKHQYNPFGMGESRCSICHMPLVQMTAEKWDEHTHTFKVIKPQVSKAMFDSNPNQDIIPNSCNQCHVDWAGSEAGYQAGVEGYEERFGD